MAAMDRIGRRFPLVWQRRHLVTAAPLLAIGLVTALTACVDRGEARPAPGVLADSTDGYATGVSTSSARWVANLTGFKGPESVRYDPDNDVFFISNMAGLGSAKDNNGSIVRMSAAPPFQSRTLVQGGVNGVQLDAPKGIALHGDTVWTADIDQLRGFDRNSGKPLATIDFRPLHAVLLNDVAVGPDGTIRVTDTGILMNEAGAVHVGPDRIFVVGPNRQISLMAQGVQATEPNGITWDPINKRWIVVSFTHFNAPIETFRDGDSTATIIRRGTGELDGVEVLPSGAIIFSSWADSSIHVLDHGVERQIIRQVPVPADIGIDTRRNRIAIPMSSTGWVQLWSLGSEAPVAHRPTER